MWAVHNETHFRWLRASLELGFPDLCLRVEDFYVLLEVLLNGLMSSEILLIKIWMLTLRGLALGVLSSSYLLKLALSSRDLPLFQDRSSAALIGSLDQGGGV